MADKKEELVPAEPPPSYEAAAQTTMVRPRVRGPPPPLELPALTALRGKRVILASASPRRRQLLAHLGLGHAQIIPSGADENLSKSLPPFEYVLETAKKKAMTVYRQEIDSRAGEPALVIAADTVVVSHMGAIMEKPRSDKDHLGMLRVLRDGLSHKVYTAVVGMAPLESAVSPGYALETGVDETIVHFDKEVTDDLLRAYVNTREGVDKAGGYAIQGTGSVLIEKIEGTYDNVVGLPLRTTLKVIENIMVQTELAAEGLTGAEGLEGDEEEELDGE
ncbi:MAG: hypothetical protein M1815_002039 [Lichina confinis]|nr:MAG: hypothetical protein M1815_002039 [Lichina confinis]